MDWTGGVRRRYAARNKFNTALAKQKAHFAKIRAAAGATQGVAGAHHQPTGPASYLERRNDNFPAFTLAQPQALQGPRVMPRTVSSAKIDRPWRSRNADRAVRSPTRETPRSRQNSGRESVSSNKLLSEEARLIKNRKKLLARSDWLGLAVARPVKIKFASAYDKDLVGKRRRIRAVSNNKSGPAAVRRPDSHTLGIPQYLPLMSGALPDKPLINVKIGSDALVRTEVTNSSPRSMTRCSQSLYLVSDCSSLSEESMLLGADGDIFEIDTSALTRSPKHTFGRDSDEEPDAEQRESAVRKTRQYSVQATTGSQDVVSIDLGTPKNLSTTTPDIINASKHDMLKDKSVDSYVFNRQSFHQRPETGSKQRRLTTLAPQLPATDNYDENETIWRRLLGVHEPKSHCSSGSTRESTSSSQPDDRHSSTHLVPIPSTQNTHLRQHHESYAPNSFANPFPADIPLPRERHWHSSLPRDSPITPTPAQFQRFSPLPVRPMSSAYSNNATLGDTAFNTAVASPSSSPRTVRVVTTRDPRVTPLRRDVHRGATSVMGQAGSAAYSSDESSCSGA